LAERARIILVASQPMPAREITRRLGTRLVGASNWRQTIASQCRAGSRSFPRFNKPKPYDEAAVRRLLDPLDNPPPECCSQWNGHLLFDAVGNFGNDQVWRLLPGHKIQLCRRRNRFISTDLESEAKAANVVRLYLILPENAVVRSVDEKPDLQVLERAQGWQQLPNSKALNEFSRCHKRHRTYTLFPALGMATGQLQVAHHSQRSRRRFLESMNYVVGQHPDTQSHILLQNLDPHKPKCDRWLELRPQGHFHFSPSYSSWLSTVEVWFGILSRQALLDLRATIVRWLGSPSDRSLRAYSRTAAPSE